ncbi:hypothetical protein [Symbiobacterium terraclitae]|uniref:hypothetical protein n=1 Tax=Symbiobacterium terraclitae TaxID=557451 RepID=UPI0035B53BF1
MPRWARFLCCTVTGQLLSFAGVLLAAGAVEQAPRFWTALQSFTGTPAFWSLFTVYGAVAAASVLAARALVNLYGLPAPAAGLAAGTLLALCYVAALTGANLTWWGGWAGAWTRLWPAAAWFALPFAGAGSLANWLWERLD